MELFYIDRGSGNNNDEFETYFNECDNVENCNDSLLKNVENDLKSDLCNNLPNLKIHSKSFKEEKVKEKNLNLNETYLIDNHTKGGEKINYFSNDVIKTNSGFLIGLEKEHSIPIIKKKIFKLRQKKEREKTKGQKWFNLPASEVTNNIKTDFQILKMRAALDKSHMYKKNNIKRISKYFQVGTVVESSADFYSGRIPKSKRKKTIVDELLADAEFKNYQKKKYKEIMNANKRKRLKNGRVKEKQKKD